MLRIFRLTRSFLGSALVLSTVAALPACSGPGTARTEPVGTTSQAETPDTFGFGSGRSGAITITHASAAVNTYAPITAVDTTGTLITVGTLKGASPTFAAGDLLMVWRTTGIAVAVPGVQTATTLATDVGGYEFARIKSVTGDIVTVTNPLSSVTRYATGSQVILVPEYTTVGIQAAASIAAFPWDGASGGIVVFFATGAVTNAGAVVADGLGFRPGGEENTVGNFLGCTALTGQDGATPCGGAHKGEGLFPAGFSLAMAAFGSDGPLTYGFGNDLDGAGGGESRGAGGGGGGGFGQGGAGGETSLADGSRPFGGLGGAAVSYAPTTSFVTLGGGGGAGDEENGTGTAGGAGGGVVLVRAGSIGGAGVFSAQGASVVALSKNDGAGGGGAGGAVILLSGGTASCTSAFASGGAGGSGATDPDGPGGGGGGGLVLVQSASGATCPVAALGGASGVTATLNVAFANSPYGATAGANGVATAGGTGASMKSACTQAQIAANLCGGCVASTDCPAGEVCDGTKNTCGTCSAAATTACVGKTPACNTTTDTCTACNAAFGTAGATQACPTMTAPACVTSGTNLGACAGCNTGADCTTVVAPACSTATNECVACNGDNATASTAPCPTTAAPFCEPAGTCGLCTSNAQCAGDHAGTTCDTTTGACVSACTTDAECAAGSWCNNLSGVGMCQALTANGQPVPGGTCTTAIGARACASAVCDTDNLCGLKNGDGPCGATDSGTSVCRSDVCPTTGPNAHLCEACVTDTSCSGTTPVCSTTNSCVACSATEIGTCSGSTPVCNTTSSTCAACSGDNGTSGTGVCTSTAAPFCETTGACGACTSSADCAGATHAGAVCDVATGTCGGACTDSTQCTASQYCSAPEAGTGACVAKLPDGASLPLTPGSLSICTPAIGIEVCMSGLCDPVDNVCGPTPDAGVDAGHDAGHAGPLDAGVTISGGAVSCDVHGGPASPGRGMWIFGLALAGTIVARRRR